MLIPELEQKNYKKLSILNIIAFESETRNSHTPEQDTCHWHSMCYERRLRFNISLREVYSKSGSLKVMKKCDESALMEVWYES